MQSGVIAAPFQATGRCERRLTLHGHIDGALCVSRPLVIAFLACNKNPARFREDASFVYRCENLGAALERLGHQVHLAHFTQYPWGMRPDVVVFHRPQLTPQWWLLMGWLRQQKVQLVADVDDLIFDPHLAALSPAVLNGRADLAQIMRRFKRHRQALQRFALLSVSTETLRDELGTLPGLSERASVHWLPNAVHHSWMTLQRHADLPTEASVVPVLRYLPGTRSHDRDFALIAEPLAAVLRARPASRLEVTGPIEFSLPVPDHQVIRRDKLPFAQYHNAVAGAHVNLAPLEDTRFTRCKSALKVIEAAFWQVPTVCSPLPDARRLARAGAHLVASDEEWVAKLGRLLDDPVYHARQVSGLRRKVLDQANVHQLARGWLRWLSAARAPARAMRAAARGASA